MWTTGCRLTSSMAAMMRSKLFKRLRIRPTLAINARVCEDYPRVAEQARADGWEFMGHSYEQGPIHAEPDQKAMVERSLATLRANR